MEQKDRAITLDRNHLIHRGGLLSESSGRSGFLEFTRSLTMVVKPKHQVIAR